jgi:hypothetical protein
MLLRSTTPLGERKQAFFVLRDWYRKPAGAEPE